MNVPVIETERLRLRGHTAADFPNSFSMWSNPAVVGPIGLPPNTPQDTWWKNLVFRGLWNFLGYGYWLVEEKSTGAFVGEVGFADFKREMKPSIEGLPELGWSLTPAMHGKGYATEAVKAAIAWSQKNISTGKIVCIIDPGNKPSLRVAEKVGFAHPTSAVFKDKKILLFEQGLS